MIQLIKMKAKSLRVQNWLCLIISIIIVMCLVLVYLAYFGALQEKRVEKLQYMISSRGRHYWDKFNLPPLYGLSNIFLSHDFEVKDEHVDAPQSEATKGTEGITGKLKEAIEESLEKTKLMMEDSAKSAADMAGEMVHKTADKILHPSPTLASSHQPHDEL